ncbi:N-6 DNA methylase [Variovorax saccharolyticus]|uniref:N-6 DNA methylase n=1 Tax=Variovorax saccharolyticus TaxID=3053516 RepID=UPI002576A51C|nr:N-6 DNA methylase [Variovorax sp. J31P216]MDM0029150.1 N-6 DNA methylase [Variovorax sp. J31P216]
MRDNARRHRLHAVFADFCELCALSISNAVDRAQFDAREARYLQIVARYERDEVLRFSQMLGVLTQWLEVGFADCLGDLFMSLELGDHWKGQFFTPFSVASLMAQLTVLDARETIEAQGFLSVSEPACGAGAMVIACAEALHLQGINYQKTMHVTATDLDATAAHMAYLQLTLLHVPAIIVHGNSLTLKQYGYWVTPAHVLGGWDYRLRSTRIADQPRFAVPGLEVATAAQKFQAPAVLATVRAEVVGHRLDQLDLFAA